MLEYPQAARSAGLEGYVRVRYDVDGEGKVVNPTVIESEPAGVFDQAALQAIRAWRFNPARRQGKVTRSHNLVSTLTFKLSDAYDHL